MDDGLIQVQAMAARIACLRMTAQHLKALHDSVLAHMRAGNADEAALEMEKHLRGLRYMWRLTRCSA